MKKKNRFQLLLVGLMLFVGWQNLSAQPIEKLVFNNPAGYSSSTGLSVTQTADGGFLLLGTADATDWNGVGSLEHPRVIKLDASLAVQWDKLYLTPPAGHGITARPQGSAVEMPNGDFVFGVRNDSVSMEIMRISATGNEVYVKTLAPLYAQNTLALSALPNGNTLAVRFDYNNDVRILHLDPAGNIAFSKSMAGVNPLASKVISMPNGDLLFDQSSGGVHNFIRTDPNGTVLWTVPGIAGQVYNLLTFPDGRWGFSQFGTGGTWHVKTFNGNGSPLSTSPDVAQIGFTYTVNGCANGNLLCSGTSAAQLAFFQNVNPDGSLAWYFESPTDGQPDITEFYGKPTAYNWAVGVGKTTDERFGFLLAGPSANVSLHTVTGYLAVDENQNCTLDPGETTNVWGSQVTATDGNHTYHAFTNGLGEYKLYLPAGTFTLAAQTNSLFFENCLPAPTVVLPAGAGTTVIQNLVMQPTQTVHSISGKVALDQNANCTNDPGEPAVQFWQLQLRIGVQFKNTQTNSNGEYQIFVDNGDYELEFYPLNQHYGVCGQAIRQLSFSGTAMQTATEDFTVSALSNCAQMNTLIVDNAIRPCSTKVLDVWYRNDGAVVAQNATLDVTLDPALTFVSAVPAATSVSGNVVHFELGDVNPSGSGTYSSVNITVLADCALQIGQQVCITAEVAPTLPCDWQGAIIQVDDECEGDSAVFRIKNIGNGPQVAPLDFIIAEDQIVLRQGTFNLAPGEEQIEKVKVSNPNSTVMATADQEPGAPGDSLVSYSLTNCLGMGGGNPSGSGYGPGMFSAQRCFPVVNSFDPNDKNAAPLGYGPTNIVRPGSPLDYTIRFQNTGNDTAFRVVVRDTLSGLLDFSKIKVLGASHQFEFLQIEDSVLHFAFDNLVLPDSGANFATSQGFVSFQIYPKPGLPLGTRVGNHAAIYFDQNAPVITNTVWRTFGEYFVVETDEPSGDNWLKINVAPNPFVSETTFSLPENAPAGDCILQVFDAAGRVLRSLEFSKKQGTLSREGLPAGMLFWKILVNGKAVASGKIVAAD